MPEFNVEQREISFGTASTPAPTGNIHEPAPSIKVAVKGKPGLKLKIRYRRAPSPWQDLPLRRCKTDKTTQYFTANFPKFKIGEQVEYEVCVLSEGRFQSLGDPLFFTRVSGTSSAIPATTRPQTSDASQPSVPPASIPTQPLPDRNTIAARLAGLPRTATDPSAITEPNPEVSTEDPLPTESVNRLSLANMALDIAEEDESAAEKVMAAFDDLGVVEPVDLASFSTDELSSVLASAEAFPDHTTTSKGRQLKRTIAAAYPTETVLSSSVPSTSKERKPLNAELLKRVRHRNPGKDLMRLDWSAHSSDRASLDLSSLSASEKKTFFSGIRGQQEKNAVIPDPVLLEKLAKVGLNQADKLLSPLSISKLEALGVSKKHAATLEKRAYHSVGKATQALMTVWDALRGGLADTAVGNIRNEKVQEFFQGLDSLETLFGEQDSCTCDACNSVLGPAAYFVDLMYFVQTHVLEVAFSGLETHPLHLRQRRPDLWALPLTCENTHTLIPQLQITTEIFENFIAHSQQIAIEPDRTPVLETVYGNVLPNAKCSVSQPFQLPLEELDIYLAHFKLKRSDIFQLLDLPLVDQLRTEIGLSAADSALISEPNPTANNIRSTLRLTLPSDGKFKIRELLDATQLSRKTLAEILSTRFVGGDEPPEIVADISLGGVQEDRECVHGLTLEHLDRLYRFLRLHAHVNWTISELDAVLTASNATELNQETISHVGRAVQLQNMYEGSVIEICALAGNIPNQPIQRDDHTSPLDTLFNLNRLVREDGLYPNPSIRYVIGDKSSIASERSMRLRSALRLNEGELIALIQGLGTNLVNSSGFNGSRPSVLIKRRLQKSEAYTWPQPPEPEPEVPTTANSSVIPRPLSFPLTLENLSLIYRHALFCRWLKLSPDDLFILIQLVPGIDGALRNLEDCRLFSQFYQWWQQTPFSLEDLVKLLIPNEGIDGQLETLWHVLRAWVQSFEDITLEATFLTQIEGITEAQSREFVNANLYDNQASTGIFQPIEAEKDGFRIHTHWKPSDPIELGSLDSDTVDIEAIQALIQTYHPDGHIPRALTEALLIDIDFAIALFLGAQQNNPNFTAEAILAAETLPDSMQTAMAMMLRMYELGRSLELSSEILGFVVQHHPALGITDSGEISLPVLQRLARMQSVIQQGFQDRLDEAISQYKKLLNDANVSSTTAKALLGLESTLATELIGLLPLPEHAMDALHRLGDYGTMVNQLSLNAKGLLNITSEDYSEANAAVAAIVAGFRAKYPDETDWQEKIAPFNEKVLEKKRDALIDYLLRGPALEETYGGTFTNAHDLYKYFLIDSEVDGCFQTSRVVAASSSLQLYIHRIRMNLEKSNDGGLQVLPEVIPDEEWEWRQHYRLWEANRKVYLWPENYLDPTIRDDKTPLFEELESELLQQNITEQTVVDAYAKYLKGMEELANLRYAGSYHHYLNDGDGQDDPLGEVSDIIYLFGATGGDAPTHYWREIQNLALSQTNEQVSPQFGPWRKVEIQIPTRAVSPILFEGTLYVFWNEITTLAQNALSDGKSRFIGYSHRYALKFTSLQLDGQWTPAERISLMGSAPIFEESDTQIDDPLAERSEEEDYMSEIFDALFPSFGIFSDSDGIFSEADFDAAKKKLITPRYDTKPHTKAQEGYTLSGWMWERPYLSLSPEGIFINCAGLHVRGIIDLFERRVYEAADNQHVRSPLAEKDLFTVRGSNEKLQVIRNWGSSLRLSTISSHLDPSFAAAYSLNSFDGLKIINNHWDTSLRKELTQEKTIIDFESELNMWAVGGSTNEIIKETEKELFIIQPGVRGGETYVLHRLGTTLVRDMAHTLFNQGVDGLLNIQYQLLLEEPDLAESIRTIHHQLITDKTQETQNPILNKSAYGIYYQEIFLHIPLLLAYHLSSQGKFEAAQRWYHYVFNPTTTETPIKTADTPSTDRNWHYRLFRGLEETKLLSVLSDTAAIQKYRNDPFNAHAIARLRISCYQKAVVMNYIDNLLDWADELFTQFQMESVNQAMMLYQTASEILGPRPLQLGECGDIKDESRTYNKLKDSIANGSDFLSEVIQLVPSSPQPSLRPSIGKFPFGLNVVNSVAVRGIALEYEPSSDTPNRGTRVPTSRGFIAEPTNASSPEMSIALEYGTSSVTPNRGTGRLNSRPELVLTSSDNENIDFDVAIPGAIPSPQGINSNIHSYASLLVQHQVQLLGGAWRLNGGRILNSTLGDRFSMSVVRQVVATFCIPRNEVLEDYWNRVEDRINKIRTCRDITGRKRTLSLFAPPIDPNLIARARSQGMSLDDALGMFEGKIPQHRFTYLLEKAKAFTNTVQTFGSALQAALERQDSETLVMLQTNQQQQILALTTQTKEWEFELASVNLEATKRQQTALQDRQTYYADLLTNGLNAWEWTQAISLHLANASKVGAATSATIGSISSLIPNLGSPLAMTYGGIQLKGLSSQIAFSLQTLGDVLSLVASSAELQTRWDRRNQDWTFQKDQARHELNQIEKRIEAAEISQEVAQNAITIHNRSLEQNKELLSYHKDKFSNLGFYNWLTAQLQQTYREAYNMALRMARFAEQAYRFEREDYQSKLLSGDYWEAPRAGLVAANHLLLDLQHLEQRYIETDQPKREITGHVFSLRQWDPMALIQLRQQGTCDFSVPELFFDISSPGDYRRRIRSVRITIPAVTGSYTNIMATLSLNTSEMRPSPQQDLQEAPRCRVEEITTSSAQNDAGVFELNFRSEKYMPFEGAGAVSNWSLSLPSAVRMFNYDTISDVLIHIDYTASFDATLRDDVQESLLNRLNNEGKGLLRIFSLKEEFPVAYHQLQTANECELNVDHQHLPYFAQMASVTEAELIFSPALEPSVQIEVDGQNTTRTDAEDLRTHFTLSLVGSAPWNFRIKFYGSTDSIRNIFLLMKLELAYG